MSTIVRSSAILGVEATPIQIEVDLLRRLPTVVIVGLPAAACHETAARVRAAIQQAGYEFPRQRVVVNLAPADLRKVYPAVYDLPIALGILIASRQLPVTLAQHDTVFLGELSLEGNLRPIRGALAHAEAALHAGAKRLVVPAEDAEEAALCAGLEVLGARSLADMCAWLRGDEHSGHWLVAEAKPALPLPVAPEPDMADVRGMPEVVRALEVAAVGGHHLLLSGPPGCGKTMLAARLSTILPDMTWAEMVETTRIHSVAGLRPPGRQPQEGALVQRRPFRAPHHSISAAGMVGNAALMPGEASLAHNGVLFLDDAPEFPRHVLETLRQPLLGDGIGIPCRGEVVHFPASFLLVTAMQPCPCAAGGMPGQRPVAGCTCSAEQLRRYRSRLACLLPSLAMAVPLAPLSPWPLAAVDAPVTPPGESSAVIRARVTAARVLRRPLVASLVIGEHARDARAAWTAARQDACVLYGAEPNAVELIQVCFVGATIAAMAAAAAGEPRAVLRLGHLREAARYVLPLAQIREAASES